MKIYTTPFPSQSNILATPKKRIVLRIKCSNAARGTSFAVDEREKECTNITTMISI